MSRPRKMHKPLKGSFTDVINAVADGKGFKPQPLRSGDEARPKGKPAGSTRHKK